jgi:hypothetical protein
MKPFIVSLDTKCIDGILDCVQQVDMSKHNFSEDDDDVHH